MRKAGVAVAVAVATYVNYEDGEDIYTIVL